MSSVDPNDQAAKEFAKLMEQDKADRASEDKALKKQRGKSTRNRRVLFFTAGGVVAALAVTLVLYDPFSGGLRFAQDGQVGATTKTDGQGTGTTPGGNTGAGQPKNWWDAPDKKYPVKLQDWQDKPFTQKNADTIYPEVTQFYSDTALASDAQQLPSESTGFTSDPSQATVDGTINPMFSYWTQENFEAETGSMLQRLINPTFGGWESDSNNGRLTDKTYGSLKDLFSKQWLDSHSTASDMPVFLGAGSSVDYLPSGGTRWIGQVKDMTTDFQYDESIRNYRVTLTADISYTTWTSDQSQTTKTVELKLSLVPNQGDYSNGSANHVVIDSGSIEVKN